MFKCIKNIDIKVNESFASAHFDVLQVLLGGYVDGLSTSQMGCIWLTSAVHIWEIYNTRITSRKDID